MLPVQPYAPKGRLRFYTRRAGVIDVTADALLSFNLERSTERIEGNWDAQLAGIKYRGRWLTDIVQPLDYVELALPGLRSRGGHITTTMRGFVSTPRRIVDSDAKVRMQINGGDYGKLLNIHQVFYRAAIDPIRAILADAGLDLDFDVPPGILSVPNMLSLFEQNIIARLVRRYQQQIPRIPSLRINAPIDPRFAINGLTLQSAAGSIGAMLQQYAPEPWAECFVADTREGPALHFRFRPWKTYIGGQRLPFAAEVPSTELTPADIVSYSVATSDAEVFNYFYTYAVAALLDYKVDGHAEGNPTVINASVEQYGFRPLERSIPWIPVALFESPTSDDRLLAAQLNDWLVRAYDHADRMESGTITVLGGGDIQPGTDIHIPQFNREFYVRSVSHVYAPETAQFQTTLGVIRGRPLVAENVGQGTNGGGGARPALAV